MSTAQTEVIQWKDALTIIPKTFTNQIQNCHVNTVWNLQKNAGPQLAVKIPNQHFATDDRLSRGEFEKEDAIPINIP
jgi:hypothetical protein